MRAKGHCIFSVSGAGCGHAEATANTEADRLLGAVVSRVSIFAFGASEGSLNQCKCMWP